MDTTTVDRELAERIAAQFLTISQAAERAGVSRVTMYEWVNNGTVKDGKLPVMPNYGGTALVWEGDLDNYLTRRKTQAFQLEDVKPMDLGGLPPGGEFKMTIGTERE